MLIHVAGSDSFLAKRAIDQIKDKYLAKNPDGAELIEITPETENPNWADLQAIPLFATSRLVIVKEAAKLAAGHQENLAHFLTNHPDTTVVIVWDGKALKVGTPLQTALATAKKTIIVSPLEGRSLQAWVKKRTEELALKLSTDQLTALAADGAELWAIENELQRLANDSTAEISLRKKIADEPFAVFNFIRRQDWPAVKKWLVSELEAGKPFELTLGGLAAAVRKELRDPATRQAVTELMMDVDIGVKTGLLDDRAAVAVLIANLPKPARERVRWEDAWEETYLLA